MAKIAAKLPFKLGGPTGESNVFRLRVLGTRSPEAYASDIEYNLRGVTRVLGGHAYENGVQVTYPGAVSINEHLAPGSKIALSRRVEKWGYVTLNAVFGINAAGTSYKCYVPGISCLGEHVPVGAFLHFTRWSSTGGMTLTGTLKVSTEAGSYLATPASDVSLQEGQALSIPVGPVGPTPGTGVADRLAIEFERTDSNSNYYPIGLALTLAVKAMHTA